MFDTKSRTVIIKTTTGEKIGPNTYVICDPPCLKQNCVPFLTNKAPQPSFITKCYTDAIYDVREPKRTIIGGASPRNRTPRFIYKSDDSPEPTNYIPQPSKWKKKKLKLDPTKPKLYACKVPYSVTVVAPSIPTAVDENGYDLDSDGNIIKIPPDTKISNDINLKSTLGGKGWRWSCRTSERFKKQNDSDGPGPAAYFRKLPSCWKTEEEEETRELARRFGFVPRFIEAQEIRASKSNQPGPGSYNIDNRPKEAKSIHPRPFIRGAQRFPKFASDTPPPNQYNICDCYRVQKQFSRKCTSFGVDAARFKKQKEDETPGPASYLIKGALQEKIERKRNPLALCDPPFNSTAERDLNFAPKDAPCVPSSADYPALKEETDEETEEIYNSVFKSRVCRFYSPAEKRDFIGPAKYNISESFGKSRNQKSFSTADVAFFSTGPRSTTPAVKEGVPCSTSYNTRTELGCRGFLFKLSPRFQCEEETVGPGAYNIHPRIEKSTYKAVETYNLRLKENVLHKKLRTAPKDTRKRWLNTLKKKKLLKFFDVELGFEERMMLLIQKVFEKPV